MPGRFEAGQISSWRRFGRCEPSGLLFELLRLPCVDDTLFEHWHQMDIDVKERSCEAYGLGLCGGLGIDYDALYVCYAGNDPISLPDTFSTEMCAFTGRVHTAKHLVRSFSADRSVDQ